MLFSPCLKKQRITGFNARDFGSSPELNHAPFCGLRVSHSGPQSAIWASYTPLSGCQWQTSNDSGETPNSSQAAVTEGRPGNLREFPETLVGGLWPQNNFHHTTKTLFPLFMDLQQHSPPAAEPETLHRLNAEATKRICLPSRAKQWFPSFALYCNYPGTLKKYRRPTLTAFWFSWYMVVCGALGFLKVPLECQRGFVLQWR